MEKESRARVFISCWQQEGSDEAELARQIAEKLENMGFEPYMATEEQTLKGLKENIFQRLSESEYLIFIDYRRERLFELRYGNFGDTARHRGALFPHQVLAIATFLNIETLAFREGGIKDDDGVLQFIKANCSEFRDKSRLPSTVIEKVEERKWNPNWRNELLLEMGDKDFQGIRYAGSEGRPALFYHVKVKNLHWQKIAHDCVAYLEMIKNSSTGETKPLELIDLKWKGVTTPRVAIPPKGFRHIDAFHIYHDSQDTVHLGINPFVTDSTGYYEHYILKGPGTFELTYVVFSENFSPARATFKLQIGDRLEQIKFSTEGE